jgi:hypothetical protein
MFCNCPAKDSHPPSVSPILLRPVYANSSTQLLNQHSPEQFLPEGELFSQSKNGKELIKVELNIRQP